MSTSGKFSKNSHFPEKSDLLGTMYDILPLAIEKACKTTVSLHPRESVTVLYLDKKEGLWQYIVEVFKK